MVSIYQISTAVALMIVELGSGMVLCISDGVAESLEKDLRICTERDVWLIDLFTLIAIIGRFSLDSSAESIWSTFDP